MKKTIIFSIAFTICGLLIALGPAYLFKACSAGCCAAYPTCLWATRITLGLGMIIAAQGLLYIIYNDPKIQLGMTVGIFLASIMVLLTIHVIIGGCAIKTMKCNLVAYPVLSAIGALMIILSGIKILLLRKIKGTE